jgi:hypothetical protein
MEKGFHLPRAKIAWPSAGESNGSPLPVASTWPLRTALNIGKSSVSDPSWVGFPARCSWRIAAWLVAVRQERDGSTGAGLIAFPALGTCQSGDARCGQFPEGYFQFLDGKGDIHGKQ